MEPWENWSMSLLCSRLQLCLLPEVEVAEPHGGIVLALTALLLSNTQSAALEQESSVGQGWTGLGAPQKCQRT